MSIGPSLSPERRRLAEFEPFPVVGRVCAVHSGEIEADGPDVSVGMQCAILPGQREGVPVRALVAAVSDTRVKLVPFEPVGNVKIADPVQVIAAADGLAVGEQFAGRAIDALARPIDGEPNPRSTKLTLGSTLPLERISPKTVFSTGVRAIDGLLTLGRGQRIGVIAPAGVGKTRLVHQILEQAEFDQAVVCLIGERGREVEGLWRQLETIDLDHKCTLVAATSDESAPMRARAVDQALALAQYWRDQGKNVLLVLDSVTRLAMALREIGLIAGEPPTARAYTPNVFRELPRIVEGCGALRSGGSITAIMTILSESEESDDPLVEIMKSLLDGHIVLSRSLAQAAHFPAIDVGRSISRLFDDLTDAQHRTAAQHARGWLARYEESRVLIASGLYKSGADRKLDVAIAVRDELNRFLRQDYAEASAADKTRSELLDIAGRYANQG